MKFQRIMLVVLLSIIFVAIFTGIAFADTQVSGVISQDTTWSKVYSPYIVTGNILVDTGATLTIKEGVEVNVSGDYCIQIRGNLIANGTKNDMININSNDNYKYNKWQGIEFYAGNNLLSNCNIYNNNGNGNSFTVKVRQYSNGNVFDSCTICMINKGAFFNNYSMLINGNENIVRNSTISGGGYTVSLWGSNNKLYNCDIVDGVYGIYINGTPYGPFDISECKISNQSYGIYLNNTTGNPEIEKNVITCCDIGIHMRSDSSNKIYFNNIYNNTYNIESIYGAVDIDVPNNYWGTIDKTEISNKIYDFYDDFNLCKVIYEPFLISPNLPTVNVTGVLLSPKTLNLYIGNSPVTLVPTITPSNATNNNITWISSNPSVASVVYGKVTPLSPGSTVITVTTEDGNFTNQCNVQVTAPIVKVTGVSLSPSSFIFPDTGQTITLTATVTPSNATNQNLIWSSSSPTVASVTYSPSVASVTYGIVTSLSPGNTTITVKTEDGNFTATCDITVNSLSPPPSGGGSGGGNTTNTGGNSSREGCFIATAAYGSYLDPHVFVLRIFRDNILLKCDTGKWLVSQYYQYSPPLAEIIAQNESLRVVSRIFLTPIVFMVEYPMVSSLFVILSGVLLITYKFRKVRANKL